MLWKSLQRNASQKSCAGNKATTPLPFRISVDRCPLGVRQMLRVPKARKHRDGSVTVSVEMTLTGNFVSGILGDSLGWAYTTGLSMKCSTAPTESKVSIVVRSRPVPGYLGAGAQVQGRGPGKSR
ncbi:hypothetical protein OS493_000826 [Desmophyllum pertusum]|uniref:Uncharacterized protein n=1 Tax=Desmophyllum pertusum TaxID=174260 RepID=A0A9W9ZTB1_9CNID|nr:hypothetical protein OS493_000826 [Desmophyllum pertusum]